MNPENPESRIPIEEAFKATLNEAEKLIWDIIMSRLNAASEKQNATTMYKNGAEKIVYFKYLQFVEDWHKQ